jgi:hypothetical protein
MKIRLIAFLCLACLTLWSCTTTSIKGKKNAVGYNPANKKILVTVIVPDADKPLRLKAENSLTRAFDSIGYHGMAALHVFGQQSFSTISHDSMLLRFNKSSAATAIFMRLLTDISPLPYTPDSVSFSPDTIRNFSGSYIRTDYRRHTTPGYFAKATEYRWEIKMYQLPTATLLYTAYIIIKQPAGVKEMTNSAAWLLVSDLLKKQLLQKK